MLRNNIDQIRTQIQRAYCGYLIPTQIMRQFTDKDRYRGSGKARITLTDGLPVVEILALNIPLPATIRTALEAEIQRQLKRADLLPVRFSSAEWGQGEVVVRGTIK